MAPVRYNVGMGPVCPHCRSPIPVKVRMWRSLKACQRCESLLKFGAGVRVLPSLAFGVFSAGAGIAELVGFNVPRLVKFAFLLAGLTLFTLVLCRKRIRLVEPRGTYCRECGYDLHGLMDGRCPECGKGIEAS